MKTLVAIRHAEASFAAQNDFERILTMKGKVDAAMMGHSLQGRNIKPDLIIASPAQRTLETAEILAQNLSYPVENILEQKKMYNGSSDDLATVLLSSDISDEINTIFMIAHNPGISRFAYNCAPEFIISHLPPCGMVGLKTAINHWADFSFANNTFLFFDFP